MAPRIQQVLPKYMQIADHIRDLILTGALRPGEEIPSERQVVDEWEVSRPTATRALAVLKSEGLVEARQGSGTFVRERPLLHRRARDRYLRSRRTGQMYTAGERSEILAAEISPAPDEVAAALGLQPGASAIRRQRVVYDPAGAVEMSTSWFDARLSNMAPALLDRTRIRKGTLAYVEAVTGRTGRTAKERVAARLATAEERHTLGLGDNPVAVLVVHHTAFDESGDPLEFAEAVYPPHRWTFEQEYAIPS